MLKRLIELIGNRMIIDIFKGKDYPLFIKDHKIFKDFKEIKKVFPEIGLPNSRKETEIDNSKEVLSAAKYLIQDISVCLDKRSLSLKKYPNKKTLKETRIIKLDNVRYLLNSVKKSLVCSKIIKINNGRLTLNLHCNIKDNKDKIVFKSGEGILRVYNKLNSILREGKFLAMERFEDLESFKYFSSKNVPAKKYNIVFSSDGKEGLWDIATMSMRGIESCQSWKSVNSSHLVGSMVDPFTAIIYLEGTTKTNYGSNMLRRCVVRFFIDGKDKPSIGLEKMYPSLDKEIESKFISFIEEKTDKKFAVKKITNQSGFVPCSKIIKSLPDVNKPYRDSGINYSNNFLNSNIDIGDICDRYRYIVDDMGKISNDYYKDTPCKIYYIVVRFLYNKSILDAIKDVIKLDFKYLLNNNYSENDIKKINNINNLTKVFFTNELKKYQNIKEKSSIAEAYMRMFN